MTETPLSRVSPLESAQRISNFYWVGEQLRPPIEWAGGQDAVEALRGQFAFALEPGREDGICLVRDRLGINKLFFAIHSSGTITVANYLIDLVDRGIPGEAIYSVPAGHVMRIDAWRRELALRRYFRPPIAGAGTPASLTGVGRRIRAELEMWFMRLASEFGSRRIVIALSGGLDSGFIAALARKYFTRVTAYTYSYQEGDGALSEDATYGQQLADFLEIPFRLVPASAEEVLGAVERALTYGQDWRDFNVHCAIVNELVAREIVHDWGSRESVLILTGDLMNEFLTSYDPVVYGVHVYYRLPKVDRVSLRRLLIQGLDAGDREIGIFGRHGLDVIQPYGLVTEALLQVPATVLCAEDGKPHLFREMAADLLPDWIFKRRKVRAQIGSSGSVRGILSVLAEAGRDQAWLMQSFRNLFRLRDRTLHHFIRAGMYRSLLEFPTTVGTDGYLVR